MEESDSSGEADWFGSGGCPQDSERRTSNGLFPEVVIGADFGGGVGIGVEGEGGYSLDRCPWRDENVSSWPGERESAVSLEASPGLNKGFTSFLESASRGVGGSG